MSLLTIPHGSPAVRWYRYWNASKYIEHSTFDKYKGDGALQDRFVPWLAENGLDWDIVWGGDYTDEMQAFLAAFRERDAQIVVDVDDHFEEVPPGNMSAPAWFGPKKRLYRELLLNADRVSASTPFLADKYNGIVTPNFIEPTDWEWPARPTKSDDECVILVACGTGRAGDYMERAKELEATLELPHVKFVFMGAFHQWALKYEPGRVVWCRWTPIEEYTRMLRWIAPDIIVSPMQHNNFNLAKSNLKWLEAGAVGAAFVGERWGEYDRTVDDGVTGVLAEGADEWRERLLALCQDADLRRRVAEAGQRAVYSGWTWPAVERSWRRAVLGED